ncbi:protein no-on-transient A-like [Artemia franciscana]|uniref:Uncharacterized protein n=2 Tax=Artemia franciscana TaxID=6661 RepID=A0AA88HPR3_ARTSF|nr:hypothetical protein QYM36_012246 [Artemia franciscana]
MMKLLIISTFVFAGLILQASSVSANDAVNFGEITNLEETQKRGETQPLEASANEEEEGENKILLKALLLKKVLLKKGFGGGYGGGFGGGYGGGYGYRGYGRPYYGR